MASTTTPRGTGQGSSNGDAPETLTVENPATGELAGTLPLADADAVRAAVDRVRASQPAWEALGIEGRVEWMGKLRDWLESNHDRVTDVMQSETGKVRIEAALEATYCADSINFYSSKAKRFLGDETRSPHSPLTFGKQLKIVHRPYPVVGIIAPWNFPLILSLGDAIPALIAGASVVIKPSSLTPLCLDEVVQAWKHELGAPDVLEAVHGTSGTGGALVDAVDFIGFTGSEETGKKIMGQAAETLTPLSLELGGKDPMVVLADANVDRAANGAAYGGLVNSGQICISTERVYVEEPVYDEFVDKLTARVRELSQGPDDDQYRYDVGAMVSEEQVEIVERHVADARDKGARILTGGARREGEGRFFQPTVIADVDHSMSCMTEETFGPTIPVMKVRDAEEAVQMANDSKFGLAGSVWSGDRGRGEAVARRLEVGACNVNDVLVNYFATEVPFGGWKQSGIGSRHGEHGIRKFTRSESLVINRFGQLDREVHWYPYNKLKGRAIRALMRFANARGLRNRLGL